MALWTELVFVVVLIIVMICFDWIAASECLFAGVNRYALRIYEEKSCQTIRRFLMPTGSSLSGHSCFHSCLLS